MKSLIEPYVEQVVTRLPEKSRTDISRELTAMLTDMVDERLAADPAGHAGAIGPALADPAAADEAAVRAAETAAVEELGDPAVLARHYRDSPDHLIGPGLMPAFRWLLKILLPVVAVLAALAGGITYTLTAQTPQIGQMIGEVIGPVVTSLLVTFAAVVLLFVFIERVVPQDEFAKYAGGAGRAGRRWSAADLETTTASGASFRGDAIASLVVLALVALLPIVPTTFFYVDGGVEGRTFVNPALWNGWLQAFYALLVLTAAMQVWKLVTGRWTRAMLAVEIALDVVFAAYLTALVTTQQVAHPEVAADFGGDGSVNGVVLAIVVVAIWAVTVWDQWDSIRAWRLERRKLSL